MMNINKYTFFKYYPGIITKLFIFLRSIILLIEEVEKYIPEEGLIYDIGCGYGLTSLYIALKSKKSETQRTIYERLYNGYRQSYR